MVEENFKDPDYVPPEMKALTCFFCKEWGMCPYAFDPYNTGGDCLANK